MTLEEIEKTHQIPLNDVVLILLGTTDEEKERARAWLLKLGLIVYMGDEFEGQEKPVVISIIKGSLGDSRSMVSIGRDK